MPLRRPCTRSVASLPRTFFRCPSIKRRKPMMDKNFAVTALMFVCAVLHVLPASAEPPAFERQALIDSYSAHVRPSGAWEEVEWPNTLDLAERGRLGVQAL